MFIKEPKVISLPYHSLRLVTIGIQVNYETPPFRAKMGISTRADTAPPYISPAYLSTVSAQTGEN